MSTPELTILMPCLNEAETLAKCITKAQAWLDNHGVQGEILIADNGSTDGSQEIAHQLGARVIDVEEKGYGSALYHGSIAALGEFIIMGDADDSYNFSDLTPFWRKLQDGYDLVMGNRFKGGIAADAMPWKNRYIGNPILTWVGKTLFHCKANDFHCGLRGFKKSAFNIMDLRTTGMEYASEMVIKAHLLQMQIAEVPTTLSKDGRSRPPHLKPWRDGWRHLKFMLLFSPRWLLAYPGLIILCVSALLYGLSITGPTQIGRLTLDTNAMFFAGAGIVVGISSCMLAVFVRMFGAREGLLPDTELLQWIRGSAVMEVGLLVGLLGVVFGLVEAGTLVAEWGRLGFGDLERGRYLKEVSFATLALMVGALISLSALVIGYLSLPVRRDLNNKAQ